MGMTGMAQNWVTNGHNGPTQLVIYSLYNLCETIHSGGYVDPYRDQLNCYVHYH